MGEQKRCCGPCANHAATASQCTTRRALDPEKRSVVAMAVLLHIDSTLQHVTTYGSPCTNSPHLSQPARCATAKSTVRALLQLWLPARILRSVAQAHPSAPLPLRSESARLKSQISRTVLLRHHRPRVPFCHPEPIRATRQRPAIARVGRARQKLLRNTKGPFCVSHGFGRRCPMVAFILYLPKAPRRSCRWTSIFKPLARLPPALPFLAVGRGKFTVPDASWGMCSFSLSP